MRPQNKPTINMKPMNVIRTRKKYFRDGDVTNCEYSSPKFSGLCCTNCNSK